MLKYFYSLLIIFFICPGCKLVHNRHDMKVLQLSAESYNNSLSKNKLSELKESLHIGKSTDRYAIIKYAERNLENKKPFILLEQYLQSSGVSNSADYRGLIIINDDKYIQKKLNNSCTFLGLGKKWASCATLVQNIQTQSNEDEIAGTFPVAGIERSTFFVLHYFNGKQLKTNYVINPIAISISFTELRNSQLLLCHQFLSFLEYLGLQCCISTSHLKNYDKIKYNYRNSTDLFH